METNTIKNLKQLISESGDFENDDQDLKMVNFINELDLSDSEIDDFIKQIETDIEYLIKQKRMS